MKGGLEPWIRTAGDQYFAGYYYGVISSGGAIVPTPYGDRVAVPS